MDKKVVVDCRSPLLSKVLEKHFDRELTSSYKAPILTDDSFLGERAIIVSEFPVDFSKLEIKIDDFYKNNREESSNSQNPEIGTRIEKVTENFILELRGILVEKQ